MAIIVQKIPPLSLFRNIHWQNPNFFKAKQSLWGIILKILPYELLLINYFNCEPAQPFYRLLVPRQKYKEYLYNNTSRRHIKFLRQTGSPLFSIIWPGHHSRTEIRKRQKSKLHPWYGLPYWPPPWNKLSIWPTRPSAEASTPTIKEI